MCDIHLVFEFFLPWSMFRFKRKGYTQEVCNSSTNLYYIFMHPYYFIILECGNRMNIFHLLIVFIQISKIIYFSYGYIFPNYQVMSKKKISYDTKLKYKFFGHIAFLWLSKALLYLFSSFKHWSSPTNLEIAKKNFINKTQDILRKSIKCKIQFPRLHPV